MLTKKFYSVLIAVLCGTVLTLLLHHALFSQLHERKIEQNEIKTIGVVLPSDINPFWIEVRRGAEKAEQEIGPGLRLIVRVSEDQNDSSQNTILDQYFARQVFDALVFGPANDKTTIPKIANYRRSGIPVVVIDTELDGEILADEKVEINAFIGSSNLAGGRNAGTEMVNALGKRQLPKKVLLIQGSFVHQSAVDRTEGFKRSVESAGVEVLEVKGEWKRDRAQELVSTHFARERFGGVFANNDDMALGAIAGLKILDTSKDHWPVVIGFDATPDAKDAILAGEMHKTVRQDAFGMGYRGVKMAYQLLNNEEVESRILLPAEIFPND